MSDIDVTQFAQCTTCALQHHTGIKATHVATAPNKMQWYECPNHDDHEHAIAAGEQLDPNENVRCALMPIEVWRAIIRRQGHKPMQPVKGFIEIEAIVKDSPELRQRRILAVDTIKAVAESVHGKYVLLQTVIGSKIYETTLDESLESFHKKLVIATGSPILPGY